MSDRSSAPPLVLSTKAVRTLGRANRALQFAELLVPKRIATEELGDAMEQILRMIQQGHPPVARLPKGCDHDRLGARPRLACLR
jgi:hypothetical protein